MIKETSAGAIIFYHKKERLFYLLLKYPNYWGFVKGIIEKNENKEETIKREAKEEANISKLEIMKGFERRISYFYKLEGKLISKIVIFLLAETTEEEAKKVKVSWEHRGFKWCEYDEAITLLKHKNEKKIFEEANSFLKNFLKNERYDCCGKFL